MIVELGGGLAAIGNTPLVQLGPVVPDGAAEVWVKLEGANPTGSYKDLFALVEPSVDGTITNELAERMRVRAHTLAAEPGHVYADQFGSPDIRPGYQPMGEEIGVALAHIDVFCSAVGTGGALMGALDGLRATGHPPDVVALEPTESPLLSTGVGGAHTVEGIAVFPDPPFLDRSALADVRTVDQERAFEMCRRLARHEGVFGGGSTGLDVCAAIDLAVELGEGHRVVTLGCDNGVKYLGGPIYR